MTRALLAALVLAALSATASAGPDSYIDKARQGRTVKKFDFIGDDIEATQVRPDGDDLNVRPFATHANLIKLRDSFAKEIMRETEDL